MIGLAEIGAMMRTILPMTKTMIGHEEGNGSTGHLCAR
jgi:hypothetical protein